ncbi:MAG: DUF177 domain-containing protein, partial [Odoribacter sp.]|nr:DUF177 domain-containing protein [Odoribacter sp.]
LLLQVKIKIEGIVKATCDSCLSGLDLNVKGDLDLYVKQSSREEGNDDDFIILAPEDDFIDLTTYLYETYMLSFPIRVVHKEGECDEEMEDMLNDYKAPDTPTDPRWDELKKLINN